MEAQNTASHRQQPSRQQQRCMRGQPGRQSLLSQLKVRMFFSDRFKTRVVALSLGFLFLHGAVQAAPQTQAKPAAPKAAVTKAANKTFLWKATAGKSTVFLLGSVHMMKPQYYPLPQAMENAYKQAQALV